MKKIMNGTCLKVAGLIAALSFCLVVIPRSESATPDPQAGPREPSVTSPQASPNLAIDPYGRVIDLTFPQEVTVTAPWDRFRFDINVVRPLARDAGAFLGDLTGDGLPDLIMPAFTGETLFFPGVGGGPMRFGSGSYLRHTQATPAENPFSFIPGDWHQGDIGDLDGDGVKDVVIGSVLYRNAGTGSEPVLDPVYTFTGGGTFDASASIGDLNADGKPDVVITWNYANGNSHIYWNNSTPGNFSFTRQALNNPHASSSQHLALGDINGDGLLDLVCPDGIYLNSGTSQVPAFDFVLSPWNKTGGPAWPATSDQPSHVVLRDGDGDGRLDAYVSDLSTTLFQVLFYKNVGTAAAHSLMYAGPVVCDAGPTDVYYHGETTPSWSGSRALAATGDIDNNGSADVLLTPSQAAGFSYPTILWNYPAAGGSHTLGYQDLYTYPSLERISPSCGADSFTSPDAACGPPNVFGGWKDVTGDGAADALRLNQGANFSLYKRVRSGTLPFTLGPDVAVNTPSGPQAAAYGLAWVDVDLDSRVDIIGGDEDGHLRWYRNIATDGSFVPADPVLLADLSGTPIDVGRQSWPAAIDLDGDSDLDLLVSNYDGNVFEVFCVTPGSPQGYALGPKLGTPQQDPLDLSDVVGGGLIAPTVTTIDVNGDGRVDVVAGDPGGRLWLLRNVATTGTASFVLEPLVISRTQAAYLETVDTHTVRLRFAVPVTIGARVSFHDVLTVGGSVSGEATILSPALGNYADASVQLGGNTTVAPDTAPISAASLNVSTSSAFKGTLAANPETGVVYVTNAQPAGTYLVTVTAFNSAGTKTFTLTVNNPTPCDALHFSAASGSPVTVGSLPAFEAVGDFNGDGNQDFAVANWGANNVTVLLGNGSGGFSAAAGSPFAVGSHPSSVAVGDFDGNGRQDLAITNESLLDNVTVLLGNGSGGFSPAAGSPFDAGYTPKSVAVGDFNGDGKPDLATANWNSNNVTVLLGNGGGGFSAAAGSPFAAGTNPASVAIGDFNGDGKADLTIANRYADSVTVLLGNGSAGFNAAIGSPFSVGANPTSVTVGDFNLDGKLDLATANRGAGNVAVLLGDGSGSFSPATGSPFAIGSSPLSVACGDFNGDGKLDLTTANIDSNNVTVLLGNGSGGFSTAAGSPFAVGSSPYLVAAGDFNGDGELDLTSVNDGSNNVSVLLNTCTSNTAPTISAADITRQQELRSANATIANVNDLEDPETALNVTVNGGTSATVNGVMVSIISTSATGEVTASVVTNCTATTATFTLRVTDTGGLFNEATLTVTIIPNTAPTLTYASPQSVVFGGSLNVTPTAAGDNGNVSYTVQPGHGLTTAPTVDSNGVVSITNAQPPGAHTITIRATDNCGVMTDGFFTLNVGDMPTFAVNDVSQAETNSGTTSFILTVTKTGGTALNSSVNFTTVDGTATVAGNDYQAQSGTLTFLSTDTTKTITVLVNGDTTFEPEEAFTVLLSGATNATISDAVGVAMITNDDNAPAFVIDDAAQPEGNVGTTVFTFTVTKTGSTALASSVDFTTVDGTATVTDNDYQPASGTLIFQPADTSKTITVLVNGDLTIEPHETFSVHLSNANNATITDADGNGFIANDDMPVLSIDDVTHAEGNAGTTAYTFTVTKTGSTTLPAAVSFATVDGSATTADNDYQSQSGRLTFQPSETTQTITVLVNGDATLEPNETFTVHLSGPSGSTIVDADGVGTITNDDVAPPTLGDYPNTTVQAGANTTVTPNAVPTGTTSLNASTAGAFKGTLAGNLSTGVIHVTNAQSAGPYTVTITAFNSAGATITKTFTLTVTNPAPCDLLSFGGASGSPFAAGPHPIFVAVGDFNLDGKQDLATANETSNDVTVLLGAGSGGFNPASGSPFAAGTQPQAVAVGDFNGDGKPDIAAANYALSNVTVLLGDGLGGFIPASSSPFATGFHPRSIAVGDFNADGRPDLVTGNASSTTVTMLLGNGSGGFSEAAGSPFGVGNGPLSIAVGDFNNDGKPDVATANRFSNNVSVLLGNGSGGFSEATGSPFPAGSEPYSIAEGDFNGDGKVDLTTANNASNNVTVLLGNGSGGFTATGGSPFAVGTNPASVAVGDFNGDGKPDLTTANWNSNNVTMLLGNGSGGFSEATGSPFAGGAYPYSVAVGDYNADGKLDFATANFDSNNVTVLLNTCALNTAPTISAVPVSRQQGSPSANATIANVNDLEDLETALTLKVNDGASATVNGVTVSGISVSAAGVVTADVIASCTATTATFTLRVTDTGSLFNEATLTVTVTPNTVPILTYASPQSVIFGGTLNVVPTSLSDNGSVTYQVMPGHGLTSVPTVDSNGVVSITNTQPEGGHFVTIRATDNCGAVTDASFSIDVGAMPAFAINNVSHNEGDTGTLAYIFTVTKTGNTAANSSVSFTTVDGSATSAGNDYQPASGVLNFSPADTTQQITVVVVCDTTTEPDESFTVHLSAPSGARITAGDGTGTIINDDCTISLSNNAENFTSAGGAASVTVTTSSACTWTAVSNDGFITINSGASGFGNGTVNYSVAMNTGPARTGTMTIAAQTFTVTQDSGCTFVLSSSSHNFVAGGGASSVNVITATGCPWSAVSNSAFITIDSGPGGSGNGTVNYSVAANNGPARMGTMTIAGITFTVTQDSGCAFTLNRDHQSFPGNGGIGAVNVVASDPNCAWTASTTSTFITITSGSSVTGNGEVQYTVAANAGSTIRSETITIAGHTFTVYQGIDFLDVPATDPFYNEIGKLAARGVTLGCTADHTLYCPNDPVTREQMAAFILRAKGEFNPPVPASQRFNDVPPANVFYNFIDRLAESQITLGCTPDHLMYCPADPVKREQMAAFILRGLGEFNPPTPSSQRFDDVPPTNVFYNFIDRLAVLNITLGCTPDHVMYCPGDSVTRAQMAAFLVRAFNL